VSQALINQTVVDRVDQLLDQSRIGTARLVTYRAEVTLIIPVITPGQGVLPVACFLKKRDYFVFRVGLHQ
jgi:hypothetical protein